MRCRKGGQTKCRNSCKSWSVFSQALLAPLSYLTAAGLLLVVGALLTSGPLRQLCPALNWPPIPAGGRGAVQRDDGPSSTTSAPFCAWASPPCAPAPKSRRPRCSPSWLISSSSRPTTPRWMRWAAFAQPDGLTGLAATGQDHHPRHSGDGHRRGGRRPAGLCGGVHFQPQL